MERHKKEKRHRTKAPRVPIKTYKWEDIRRARLKGGYPWTYLYKEPFHEKPDQKSYKMDTKSKNKKSSYPKDKSNKLEIQEINNGAEESDNLHTLTPESSGLVIITEVPSDSENHSKDEPGTSVTIEDIGDAEAVNLESAESSDNISQYLDKEEPTLEPVEASSKATEDEQAKVENGRQERAKSEEPKRKRKLSIDSSYSRKSLSKLAILKKLKDAKNKFKVPKLNLPSLPNLSVLSNPLKSDAAPKSKKEPEKKQEKETHSVTQFIQNPNAKAEYIHIPLKPPEGETDEFSYLEFGEKKPEEPKKEEEQPKPPEGPTIEISEAPSIQISEAFDDQRRFSGDPDDIVAFEILKSETIDLDHATKNGFQGGNDYLIIEQEDDEKSETRSMIIIMPGSEEPETSRPASATQSLSRQGSKKVRAKSAEPERKRKLSADSSYSRISLSKLGIMKKLKEAKDKFKLPKFSLSKTDSKKDQPAKTKQEESVPKEAKIEVQTSAKSKNEPKYIHIPLKPPDGETDEFSHLEFEKKEEEKEIKPVEENTSPKEEQSSIESPASPKTEGVQFIFLTPPSDDEFLDHPVVPETPSSENQSFFATRLDEIKQIAKDAVDSESPKPQKKLQPVEEEESADSSQSKSEIDDAKKDEPVEKQKKIKSKTKKQKQDKKSEEESKQKEANKTKSETDETANDKKEEKVEKMVVDEEDGLKLTESAMAKQEQNIKAKEVVELSQELKSSLKTDGSPILKKKVSFKRRSRDDSKDGDYEDVQSPAEDKASQKDTANDECKSKLAVMENSQSMSVDEEKSYLDEQKIIKSTSLEEDYNRWSKLSDHEYEPVNPPPDNVSPVAAAPPTVHVIDSERRLKPSSRASSTTSLERRMLGAEVETSPEESFTVHEMQAEIENKFFSKSAETPSKHTTVHTVTTTNTSESQPRKPEGPNKLQQAIKAQTDKFKTKLHEIKKPNIKLPSRPTFKKPNLDKFKFEKPKINLPKIPDTTKITLPTFSLPRKSPTKRSLKQRQLSTESNAGGSKKNYFDFRTYPRLFKKKPKDDLESFSSKSEREVPEFATVPRTKRNKVEDDRWGGRESIRIPLHAEDSVEDEQREDSVERRMASHIRYDQDIDIDDAYEKENQEIHAASPFSHSYNSRWNHGSFHPTTELAENERNRQVTDLDSPEEGPAPHESFDTNTSKDIHSSESSLGIHRRGVLEEIDSDEFFLRQKGISQDNIEVGMYLSSEIREAFKSPTNALADLQREPPDFSYDVRTSNQSLPETPAKRKSAKKPKRKKTPHVSHEQISFDQDSELDNELPPSRPRRRSKRNKKQQEQDVIPYQETIAVEQPEVSVGILQRADGQLLYENEQMEGKEQPEITLVDPYHEREIRYDSEEEVFKEEVDVKPSAPPRKHRSLRSLNYSEHDSILGDVDPDRQLPFEDTEIYKTEHEYIIPTPEVPPIKPPRTLSRSSSKSHDTDINREVEEVPIRPTRTRSRSQTRSQADSQIFEELCVEEVCVQDFRDSMGYAVIDKNQRRDPPLPPPRTPPRRKRSIQSASSEQKFFTVPRSLNDEVPVRPLRNYSTLGPSRPPRRKQPINMTDEEKENIDITQYIEIEDEPNRDLHSGEVIQKMRDRPLPAPPRPPRKTRNLHDITSQENIITSSQENIVDEEKIEFLEEAEVSTQTDPLPDDFECEEPVHEESDVILTSNEPTPVQESEPVRIQKHLITPSTYTYDEETITHGSLVVQPIDGAKILPDSEFSRIEKPVERNISISKDYEDETSEVPEEFLKLKDPEPHLPQASPQPSVIERIIERPVLVQPDSNTEVEVLKAHKLQVTDLDVDRLSVNELLASRIVVSEIDSGNIQATEISSKSGALKVGEIELPPGLVQQLFERLQSVAQEQSSGPIAPPPVAEVSTKEASEESGQKKTPIEQVMVETLPPQRPPRKTEETHEPSVSPLDALEEPQIVDIETTRIDSLNISETEEIPDGQDAVGPPVPPVRTDSSNKTSELERILSIPEDIEEPEPVPQRPPRHTEKFKVEERSSTEELIERHQTSPPEAVFIQEEAVKPQDSLTLEETTVDIRQSIEEQLPTVVPIEQQRMEEPEIDDEPPPRPPQPQVDYIPSQPPASFYALRAQQYVEDLEGDIPMAPRRRRHQKPPISRSSSDESPAPPPSRRRFRSPEPTIPQLTGQLIQACGSAANSSIKRLITHISNNVLRNADGQQDLHVIIVILLVLIAGLILLGYGDGKTVHYHHWEFFNPPRDM